MIQVGYKLEKDGKTVVRLKTINLETINGESEFTTAKNFIFKIEDLLNKKDQDSINQIFYKSEEDGDLIDIPVDSDMKTMRKMLECYLVENKEKFIFTLIHDKECNEIKPFLTIYRYDDDTNEEEKGACMSFKDVDGLVKYLKTR